VRILTEAGARRQKAEARPVKAGAGTSGADRNGKTPLEQARGHGSA
jgi:hypothetical protein